MLKQIQKIIDACKKPFKTPSGLSFNHLETIKRINAYSENKYVKCTDDKAIFWNDVEPEIPHFAKNIDLDSKNLRPNAKGDLAYYKTWVLRLRFNVWVKKNGLAITLDDIAETLARYGSCVVKTYKEKGTPKIDVCDFSKLYYDYSIDRIAKTNVVEEHWLTAKEISDHYDISIKDVEQKAEKVEETNKYKLWEFTGYNEDEDEFVHSFSIGKNEKEDVLFSEEYNPEKPIYYDFHLSAYRGRHLRVGCYERCFPEMERQNKLVNFDDKSAEIASLLLLRTNDPSTTGNVLNGAESGDIITSADLQQIGIDNRFLNEFLAKMNLLKAQIQRKCMTPEIITGENLPANTPFRSVAVISNAAKSAFKSSRDRLGDELVRLINYFVLPALKSDMRKEAIVQIAEDINDIKYYDKMTVPIKMARWLEGEYAKGRTDIPLEEIQSMEQDIIATNDFEGRKLTVEKGEIDFDFDLEFNPTGEVYDKQQQNSVYEGALNYKIANPAIANDALFKQYLENNGISPVKLSQEEIQQLQQTGQQAPMQPKQDKLSAMVDSNV